MRILICPNAYKGSLTAFAAAQAITKGLHQAAMEGAFPLPELICLPLADGGDGTLETLVQATGGTLHTETVLGPLGKMITAQWGRLGGGQADVGVIEMAQASGLRLVGDSERDPLRADTFGTGQLMRAAVEAGCRTLLVGIGGSATNDGGTGMARALGARLFDAAGRELPPGGAALIHLAAIDLSGWVLPPDVQVRVACDVDNPLCGPEGASAIYGPQKGATPAMVAELDAALRHYADVLREQLGKEVAERPGAGAAGGLGAGLMAFCNARLERGTELIFDLTGFDALLTNCDLVITGEGRLDDQTSRGKVVAAVARRAQQAGIPVVGLAGAVEAKAESALRRAGLTAVWSILSGPMSVETAMAQGETLLAQAAARLWHTLQIGHVLTANRNGPPAVQ